MASPELTWQLPSWPLIDFHAHFPVAGDDILEKLIKLIKSVIARRN
ncbi:MAG: hypothetical protein ACYC0N_02335 [Carboxydocellales bacterium]